jgi:hypothetical protein
MIHAVIILQIISEMIRIQQLNLKAEANMGYMGHMHFTQCQVSKAPFLKAVSNGGGKKVGEGDKGREGRREGGQGR